MNMVKKMKKTTDKTLAIVGLIFNILFWPGLGTIIGGDIKKGIIQMVLFLIGIPLGFIIAFIMGHYIIGYLGMVFGVKIWAVISSIDQIKHSK